MTKRQSNFENSLTKKARVEDFNDFWDDDIDSEEIENCFRQATQICENKDTNQANITHLPPYSFFQKSEHFKSSTQFTQPQLPSNNNKLAELERQLKEYREKYEEKEGEVSILRANLKNLKAATQADQEKKQNEFQEKLVTTQKENKAIKSQLDFKNLEIANLKQQIADISKLLNNPEPSCSQKPHFYSNAISPRKNLNESQPATNYKIQTNSEKYYPLKNVDCSSLFMALHEENHVTINKKANALRGATYLNKYNQESQEEIKVNTIIINEKELDLDFVYPELSYLINLSEHEINSEISQTAQNKIICVSLQFLSNFYDYLKQIENNIQLEDVQESDSLYLQNINENTKGEIGIRLGKLLTFLAALLPFSSYLRNYLQKKLTLRLNADYIKFLPAVKDGGKCDFLSLLLKIICIIGRIRKEMNCSQFLTGVIKLLTVAFKTDLNNAFICEIALEILFLRPDFDVIVQVTYLVKSASKNPGFSQALCTTPNKKSSNKSTKGIIYFNRDSCRFHIFAVLLENVILKMNRIELLPELSINVLNFIYNIFNLNCFWLYQQESKKCECLCQLYKLSIGIIYRNLKIFQEAPGNLSQKIFLKFSKNSIQILGMLTFNSYDLMEKYVTNFAQFKEIVYILTTLSEKIGLSQDDLNKLERLGASEDLPEIASDKFAGLQL